MSQPIVINIGAIPNDGTGDPLRTAFNDVNLNFANVFAYGPVLSNIRIANNTILTTNTNGNLVLNPNGIGIVQANAHVVPDQTRIRSLGSANLRWDTVYTQYATVYSDLSVGGNLSVVGNVIQIGNIVTDSLTIQLANTAGTANAANGAGITVGANDNIATLLYNSTGNVWTTNIGVSAVGNITGSNVVTGGVVSAAGNVRGANFNTVGLVSASGNITGNYLFGNGSQLTGLPAGYANANAVAYGEAGWAGNIIPGANVTYSLGNSTNQWKDLWVSNTTIYLGGTALSVDSSNTLTVNGIPAGQTAQRTVAESFVKDSCAAAINGGLWTTGVAGQCGTTGALNYPTLAENNLVLVDNDTYVNLPGSYVFGDPWPDNITWTPPVFDATLTLVDNGIDPPYYLVSDIGCVEQAGGPWPGQLNLTPSPATVWFVPVGYSVSTVANQFQYKTPWGYVAEESGVTLYVNTNTVSAGNLIASSLTGIGNTVSIATNNGGSNWTFDYTGNLTLPGNTFAVNYANGTQVPLSGGGGGSELVNGDNSFVLDVDGNVVFEGIGPGDGVNRGMVWDYGAVANGVNSQVRQDFSGLTVRAWTEDSGNYVASVNIVTNQDANTKTWVFDGQGNLTIAGNIQSVNTGFAFSGTITNIESFAYPTPPVITIAEEVFEGPVTGQVTISNLNPSTGALQANGTWYYEAVEVNQFTLYTDAALTEPANTSSWTAYLGPGGNAVSLGEYTDFTIQGGNVTIGSNNALWTFNNTGNLTFPDNSGSGWPVNTQRFGMGNIGAWLDGQWTIGEFSSNGVSGEFGIRIDPSIEGPVGMTFPSSATSNTQPVQIYSTNGGGISLTTGGSEWTFDSIGDLTAPGNIIGPNIIASSNFVGTNLRTNLIDFNWSDPIVGITTGANTYVTLDNNVFGDPYSGQIIIEGVLGATEANGNWWYAATNSNEFELFSDAEGTPVDSTSWGAYTSGGLAYTLGYTNIEINAQNITIRSDHGDYNNKIWSFNRDGSTVFPTLTVDLHNGGTQTGQTLQFGDPAQQAFITGPTPAVDNNAQRLIIQGQRGLGTGEGGDVYLWAGDSENNGGDIKIYAGDADSETAGDLGGYVNIDGGAGYTRGGQVEITGGYSSSGDGGYINLIGGSGNTYGGNVGISAGYGQAGPGGAVTIQGGGSNNGLAEYGNVGISAGASSWAFDNTGNLTLPQAGVVYETNIPFGGLSGKTIALKPYGGTDADQQLLVYPTAGADFNHLHLTTGNLWNTEMFLGNDDFYVKLANTGNIVINTNDNGGNTYQLNFTPFGEMRTTGDLFIQTPNGVPNGVTAITGSSGSWESNPTTDLPTTDGTGAGLTVTVTETGGYASAIAIVNPGSGYANGDVITVTSGSSSATFTISVANNQWILDTQGELTLPTISLGSGLNEQTVISSQRKLIPPFRWSAEITGTTPTVVYTATSVDTTSMKVTVQIQHSGLGMEFFEVFATFTGADTFYTVSNRVAPPTIDASTVVVDLNGSNEMQITVTINSGAGTSWVTYDAVEFGIPND